MARAITASVRVGASRALKPRRRIRIIATRAMTIRMSSTSTIRFRDMVTPLLTFLRPLYQDLDGVSHVDEVERIDGIARSLYDGHDPTFERLILFHKLGRWLEKVGNLSRASLATG